MFVHSNATKCYDLTEHNSMTHTWSPSHLVTWSLTHLVSFQEYVYVTTLEEAHT